LKISTLVSAAALVAAWAMPAFAQKSANTVRIAVNDPWVILSSYHINVDEASNFYRGIYEPLISYDERGKKWVPMLAKSFTQVSPTVIELELRNNVTFHNGNKFDADDVMATINFLIDPKSKVSFKQRYDWISKLEKLNQYKVRITAKEPLVTNLQLLAFRMVMWDAETMKSLQDQEDYGRNPVGTGPMKAVFLDRNKGALLEALDAHYGDKKYQRAGVKRVHGVPLPDRQTQIAQLLTGGIDMIRNASPDDARELGANRNLDVSILDASNIFYVAFDSQGTSGNKLFTDPRVRKAMWMAIERDPIIEHIVPGGAKHVKKLTALCFETTTPACNPTVELPKYDPEGAKKLLAEAGYPNGIEYEYTVVTPQKPIAEAVAGSLLKANIRAKIRPVPISVYQKERNEGKLVSWTILFPSASHPDASNILETLMTGATAKYYEDPTLFKLLEDGQKEFDDAKRGAIYQKAYDRVNSQYYIYPMSSIPNVFVHSKEIKILDNPLMAGDTSITDYTWK
jgi:peptide/nickel transport system substrate-binding protein